MHYKLIYRVKIIYKFIVVLTNINFVKDNIYKVKMVKLKRA